MNSDLTFITNDRNQNLKQRFKILIKDTKYFELFPDLKDALDCNCDPIE